MTLFKNGSLSCKHNFGQILVRVKNLPGFFQLTMFVILLLVFAIFSITAPNFLTMGNLLNIIRQSAPNLIVAISMTIVITTGGIDLSVGSMLAVSSVLSAMALNSGWGVIPTFISMLLIGLSLGAINGLFVGYQKIPPFIVTLASMSILRGLVLVLTEGYSIPIPPGSSFITLGRGWIFGIPVPAILAIIIIVVGILLLTRTPFGVYVTGVGSNEEAVRRSGVDTKRVKLLVYMLSGLFTALAGMIVGARLASGSSYTGTGFELSVIAAVILGGTNLFGGDGNIIGTIIGVLLLAIVGNGLIMLHISPFYEQIIQGIVLLIAIWFNITLSSSKTSSSSIR